MRPIVSGRRELAVSGEAPSNTTPPVSNPTWIPPRSSKSSSKQPKKPNSKPNNMQRNSKRKLLSQVKNSNRGRKSNKLISSSGTGTSSINRIRGSSSKVVSSRDLVA